MVDANELRELVNSHHEWLLVRDAGRTFPLECHEIEIDAGETVSRFGFLDDSGFHSWRLNSFSAENDEITMDVAREFAKKRETMRLLPRTSASVLSREIELARLQKANEIAELIATARTGVKLGRVALNIETGRLAQINFDLADKTPMAAIADVTASLTVEAIFTAAIIWLEKLGLRKKRPVLDIWIIAETKHAKQAQKLHALLDEKWKNKITIVEIVRREDPPRLVTLPARKLRELWREKATRLSIPHGPRPTSVSQRIIALSPDEIDIIFSRQGETLRFAGLPFARVRTMLERESAWFGIGRRYGRTLTEENWLELRALVDLLRENRAVCAPNKRHEFYRAGPEAWLESILRRNINLLDANLILSPLYNQFRFLRDKIDLLALRKDGRLVIIELKTQPDREVVFQAVDYWRKIELQRRRGVLAAADLFDGRKIADRPAIIYTVAPAWSFHRDFEFFARSIAPEIELWRFELHENWREKVKVLARQNYAEARARR
ncbi:MAG TPA: hypothetical protein VNA17_09075 [Pyrinomonadaceae bacterium]|nr:hypothetical protein [Pyrinomonadaceae bacterium]